MRVKPLLGVLVAATCVAVLGLGTAGSADATVQPPSVVTTDTNRSVYLADGTSSTLLRNGRPDVYPWASSLDGSTSLWTLGTAFRQVAVVHAGHVVHVFDDVAHSNLVGDVSADGSTVVVAVTNPDNPGLTSVYEWTVATGVLHTAKFSILHLEDIGLSADGSAVYYIWSGTPARLDVARNGLVTAAPWITLTGVNLPWDGTAYVRWSSMSSDLRTVAMDVVTNATKAPAYEGWVATSTTGMLPEQPVSVRDAGSLPANTIGRFLGTELDVAEAGQLLAYASPDSFVGTPDTTTAMPMTGNPDLILSPAASLGTSFPTAAPFSTFSQPWIVRNGSATTATSTTVYLNAALPLYPAVQATNGAPWHYFGYWDDRSTFLLYSTDHVHWADYPWSTQDFLVNRSMWVRALHTADINSGTSISPVVIYTAKPYLVVHYTASTRHLYGTVNTPNGSIVQVQRRTSTGAWSVYYSRVPVSSYAWSVSLPAVHATWRVVAPATGTYIATVSAAVTT